MRKLIVKASVGERLPGVLSRYPASTISWLCLPRKNVQSFPGSALIMWLCESLKQNFTLEGFSAALVICGSTRRIFASRGLQSWDNHQPRECGARPRSGQPPDVCLVWSFLLLYCDKICSVTSCPKCYYLSPISDEGLKIDFSDSDYLKYFVVPSHSFSEIMYFPEY